MYLQNLAMHFFPHYCICFQKVLQSGLGSMQGNLFFWTHKRNECTHKAKFWGSMLPKNFSLGTFHNDFFHFMTFPSVYLSLRIRHLTRMRVVGVTQIGNTKCVRCLCCKSTSYASRICPLNGDFSDCYLNAEWRGRSCVEVSKIRVSGCARCTQSWVFFKTFKIQFFCCFITRRVWMLQQWSLYEVIEDILPFVLNTKRPLSDIWLLIYRQNTFGCFLKKI